MERQNTPNDLIRLTLASEPVEHKRFGEMGSLLFRDESGNIEAYEQQGPQTFHDFISTAMHDTLMANEFGTYCHEGGDLLADTLQYLEESGLKIDDLRVGLDKEWDVGLIAERIVAEHERQHCEYCTGTDIEDEDDYDEGDE